MTHSITLSTLEVTPATFDEIADKLKVVDREHVDLGGIELHRGPIPPVLLPADEAQAIYTRTTGLTTRVPLSFARAIEFEVLRRTAVLAEAKRGTA